MTSLVGGRMGCFSAEMRIRKLGKTVASLANVIHSEDTKANCTRVRVAGMSKTLRMDLDEVLVRAEEVYHSRQRTYVAQH